MSRRGKLSLGEHNMPQGKRTRALDSRGRPVPGLYIRDGRFTAGAKIDGVWTMKTLDAETLTEARRERESWLAGRREGRIAAPTRATFSDVFADWQKARKLSPRTAAHERHVAAKRLDSLGGRRVQEITSTEVAAVLRDQAERYAPYSCAQTFRLLAGTFAHAQRRGLVTRNPIDGLASTERPEKRAKRNVVRLDAATLDRFVAAGDSERWRVDCFGRPGAAWCSMSALDVSRSRSGLICHETEGMYARRLFGSRRRRRLEADVPGKVVPQKSEDCVPNQLTQSLHIDRRPRLRARSGVAERHANEERWVSVRVAAALEINALDVRPSKVRLRQLLLKHAQELSVDVRCHPLGDY